MKRVFIISLFIATAFFSISQTPQIERLQKQQQALQEEIKNTNKLYLDVKKQTTSMLDRINLINKQISSVENSSLPVRRRSVLYSRRNHDWKRKLYYLTKNETKAGQLRQSHSGDVETQCKSKQIVLCPLWKITG